MIFKWVFLVLDCSHIKIDLNDDAKIHVLKHINRTNCVNVLCLTKYLTCIITIICSISFIISIIAVSLIKCLYVTIL